MSIKAWVRVFAGVALVLLLSSCSSFDGAVGKSVETFTDSHGRACTALKWGEGASLDCDFPREN